MVHCSWASGPSFLPVPSALLSFRSLGGKRRIHPVGWFGVVSNNPPLLTVCFRPGTEDRGGLHAGDPFFVSLPNEELLQPLAGRMRQGQGPDLASAGRSPLSVFAGEEIDGPLAGACPVQIECRCLSLKGRFGQHRLCGEVLALHLDGRRHELVAPVDFCRLMPLQRRRFQGLGASCQSRRAS